MSNKQIEAMKLALKALENSYALRDDIIDAKEALREALAQSRSDEEQPRAQSPDGGGTLAQQEPTPTFTTGHCKEKAKAGGCQLHNIQCGFPACDRKEA